MKFIENIDLCNKKVLIRVDYNVPLENGEVKNDFRIKQSLETIKYCLDNNAAVILMSHMGRPNANYDDNFSLETVSFHLEELLNKEIMFVDNCISEEAYNITSNMKSQEILLLENLRFHEGEVENCKEFSKMLSKHADVYINDAFGTAHRSHASNVGVLDCFAVSAYGYLIKRELHYLKNQLENPDNPFLVIIGGAKISSKIHLITHLLDKADTILIGGAMSFTFQKALGYETGKSLVEYDEIKTALTIIEQANKKGVNLQFPVDAVCATEVHDYESIEVKSVESFDNNDIGLDIGPETCINFQMLIESAKTIIWNGPLGLFEIPYYSTGTQSIATSLQEHGIKNNVVTIIGGGDTVSAIHNLNTEINFSHISTGGGASLELLSGKKLTALKDIEK
ncbi:MAG: phosphoglycerate kinase [bacterium TMED161]|nr:phosphoglycerate kinase [Candidatus Neomarinimicrobiota bacterium]OUW21446.1 MAG: phosphoglycerate kinase [bacterium TMED161]|tara:strand:- start:2568 stop:3755 length:1188 start_codon:yes stop_codon:yes gene_type:complete